MVTVEEGGEVVEVAAVGGDGVGAELPAVLDPAQVVVERVVAMDRPLGHPAWRGSGERRVSGRVQIGDPCGEVVARALDHPFPADLLVAHMLAEWCEQAEVGVHGLEPRRLGLPEVVHERAEHGRRGRQRRLLPRDDAVQVDAGQDPGRRRLRVSLHAGELAGEDEVRRVGVAPYALSLDGKFR
jgi:hypothetical protein